MFGGRGACCVNWEGKVVAVRGKVLGVTWESKGMLSIGWTSKRVLILMWRIERASNTCREGSSI